MAIKEIIDVAEFKTFISENKKVVACFFKEWGDPLTEKFKEVSENSEFDEIGFCQTNINHAEKLAHEYDIEQVPAFIFFINAKTTIKLVGVDVYTLVKMIRSLKGI